MSTLTRRPHGLSLAAAAYVFGVVMMGTTMPTPLYPLYEEAFGFGSAQTTVLFAVYAGGVIGALVFFGRLSDALGRRPLLLAGIVLSLLSALAFAVGTHLWMLYVGRVISGLAAGILTATGTVVVTENTPPGREGLGSAIATAANIGGLGIGILMAGVFSEVTGLSVRSPYILHAILLVIAALALIAVHDPVRPDAARARLQLPSVPRETRGIFLASAVGAVAGFAVCGIYSSVGPNFMGGELGLRQPAAIGVVIFLLFGTSAVAQILSRRAADRALILWGSLALVASMILMVLSLTASSLALFILSSVLSGVGQGLLFMTGMRAITRATRPEE